MAPHRESLQPAIESPAAPYIGVEETTSDATLWAEVTSARDAAVFARAWLTIVARSFPAIRQGAVLFRGQGAGGKVEPVARWARDIGASRSDLLAAAGAAVLRAVVESGRPAIEAASDDAPVVAGLPFVVDSDVRGAVLVEASAGDTAQSRRLLRHLHWGSAWVENFLKRSASEHDAGTGERALNLIDTLNAVVSADSFEGAAWAFLQRLALIFKCERVAIGQRKRLKTRLIKLHQAAIVGRRSDLASLIEGAMDEAIDQGQSLFVPSDGSTVARAGDKLLAQAGGVGVLTVPLVHGEVIFGAATLERFTGAPFGNEEVALCEALCAAAAPVLVDKRERDRGLPVIAAQRAGRFLAGIVDQRNLAIVAAVVVAMATVFFLATAKGEYRIRARAQIQGEIRRVVNAPFDGYLKAAAVRAGAVVHQGDVLAEMQDSDLAIDRLRHVAERRQHELELDRALAKDDLAAVNIARAQMAAEDAQVDLDEQMLARTAIRAPFDGIVVAGDLSQAIGRPVARGDNLFELAPLDRYRVSMVAAESDVAAVQIGASGDLLLTALPDRPFRFTVTSVTPVARTTDGTNGFEVQGALDRTDSALRPAMEGTAKIDVGPRPLFWIGTHRLFAWARIALWGWVP